MPHNHVEQRDGEHSNMKRVLSSVVWGSVYHCRMSPRRHEFAYPVVTLQLDVDQLEAGTLNSGLFGYNRSRFLSVRGADYLRGAGTLRERVETLVREQGVQEHLSRITLVTMPRVLGYIFNPVSFFICFRSDEKVVACVTQVHNTFGEAHLYPLVCEPQVMPVEWRFAKSFFVSPFFDTQGEYRVVVEREGTELGVVVDLFKSGQPVFVSALRGQARVFSVANLLKTLIRFPFTLVLTMPRIHIQASFLFLWAKVTPYVKPPPASPYTIRSRQNRIHRARLWLLSKMREARSR